MNGATKDIEYYTRALRAPRIADGYRSLGDRAREAGWSHEEHLAAVLSREVAEREASGAALRIRAARFPGHKLLEEFNFHQPAADRNLVAHLGTGVFLEEAKNVVLLGPPAPAKPIWPSGSESGPHTPGTASCSTPRPGGYQDWPKPTTAAACPRNWPSCADTNCSSLTKSATSPSTRTRPTSSSSWSHPATNTPPWCLPATSPSAGGAKSSATRQWPRP